MKRIRNVMLLVIIILAIGFFAFAHLSNPIVLEETSSSNRSNDVVLHLYNEGLSKVQLTDVLINNQPSNLLVDLGVLVQFVQSQNEVNTYFDLGQGLVIPRVTTESILDVIDQTELAPMQYGIRIKNFKEPIESITIKYKYLGLTISKEIKITS